MASVKGSDKGSITSKSTTSTPTRQRIGSQKSSQTTKVVRAVNKGGAAKTKQFVRSDSSPPISSVSSVYATKDQITSTPTRSKGVKSKQGSIISSKGTQSTVASKQTASPKSKPATQKDVSASVGKDTKEKTMERTERETKASDLPNKEKRKETGGSRSNSNESSKENDTTAKEPTGNVSDNNRGLLEIVRERLISKGRHSIHGLGLLFRHLDVDYNKRIVFGELKEKLRDFGVDMSDGNLHALFRMLDVDKSGGIDFLELMTSLRPPMKECRRQLIEEAFDKVDSNGSGVIDEEEIKVVYSSNARRHPRYLSGEWTEEQTLRHFLDSLDTPGSPDGKVTRQEFLNYYAGVSATVDDDCFFDLMMRSVYGLPPTSSN